MSPGPLFSPLKIVCSCSQNLLVVIVIVVMFLLPQNILKWKMIALCFLFNVPPCYVFA